MIRLAALLENTDTSNFVLIHKHFSVISGNYEEWLEDNLADLVDAGQIDEWAAYDTMFMLQRNMDTPEDFMAYIKYRHKLTDPVALRAFVNNFMPK
jgi:hypothetical protein